jgi:hypothetical protein
VIEHCGLIFYVAPPANDQDPRLLFLGDDESGIALEVMAVELEGGELYAIHAMPLRDRYRAEYEEAKRWRG